MEARHFPKEIYVTGLNAGTSQEALTVHRTEKQSLERGSPDGIVATYRLVEVRKGSLEPDFSVVLG